MVWKILFGLDICFLFILLYVWKLLFGLIICILCFINVIKFFCIVVCLNICWFIVGVSRIGEVVVR